MNYRRWILPCAVSVGLLTACQPAAIPEAPLVDAGPSAASPQSTAPEKQATLDGTVWYRQRSALPEGAVVEVSLLDVLRADAPAIVLAQSRITTVTQEPIAFVLHYPAEQILARHSYAVQARILLGDRLLFVSTERYAVLTRDAPSSGIQVRVDPV